ncbi:PQQ-dependent sugar dehydrogenase [Candidatus Bathyarchaeota archaeon]|nr:MAG: PQQ-dependent sugar dehydrogenase [Candidatus Bathyarchaeota archaeon]
MKTVCIITLSLGPWMFLQAHASSPVSTFLSGVNFPVSLSFAPDGRIFFTEKDTGSIRIIQSNSTLLATPFATVPKLFHVEEAGLLGIALDPAFSTNQYVYVYYTYRDVGSYTHGHIVRYTATGNSGIDAFDLFDVVSSAPNTVYHNGGYIKFGPDGKLYAVVGEFHQSQQAQNESSMTGKMLRMNSDGSVPGDNPIPGSRDYALGIRNSFGFDFDPSNGRLVATMAGPTSDDKILIIVKGGNYGWPTCLAVCHDPRFIDPIVDFSRIVTPTGIATVAPNAYIFGEYTTGDLVQLQLDETGGFVNMTQIDNKPSGIIAVEHGPNNKLYYTTPNAIYTYDLPVSAGPNAADPGLILLGIGVATAGTLILIYTAIRYRRGRTFSS